MSNIYILTKNVSSVYNLKSAVNSEIDKHNFCPQGVQMQW